MSRVVFERDIVISCESLKKAEPYVDAVVAVGVESTKIRVVTPENSEGEMQEVGAQAYGVVVCGGPDLEPWRYGEQRKPDVPLYANTELDEIELSLLEGAWSARTPVFAICRGMQAVNVLHGGTLYQDIPTELPDTDVHDVPKPREHLAHKVEINGSLGPMGELLRRDEVQVNTRHHQAVKTLGEGLSEVGTSPDGILEAIEWESEDWWMWGVQWHPENLLELDLQRELWRRFEQAVKTMTQQRGR